MFLRRLVSVVLVVLLLNISVSEVFAIGTTRASTPRVSAPKVSAPKVTTPKTAAPKTKTEASKSTKVDLTKKDTSSKATTNKTQTKSVSLKKTPVTTKITTEPKTSGLTYGSHPVYYSSLGYVYFMNGDNDCDYDDYLEGDIDCQPYYADEDDVKQPTPKQDKHGHGWFIFWIVFFMLTTALFVILYILKYIECDEWIKKRQRNLNW